MNLTLLDRLDEEYLGRGGVKGEVISLDLIFNCGKQIQTSNYLLENTPVAFKHWVMTLNIWISGGKGKKKKRRTHNICLRQWKHSSTISRKLLSQQILHRLKGVAVFPCARLKEDSKTLLLQLFQLI